MTLSSRSRRLSPLVKLAYGIGDFGFAFSDTSLRVLFGIFLVDVVGLTPSLAALAVFIGRSRDYLHDPLIGQIADRTRTRSIIFAIYYPLSRESHTETRKKLAARKEAAAD